MRKPRVVGGAVIPAKVRELLEKFEYPDELPDIPPLQLSGGGGMAHYLIVSDSEPVSVQAKADFVIASSNSGVSLQAAFDEINADSSGLVSIWMAGTFDLDVDVAPPDGAWIRGLGYAGGIGV